MELDVHCYSYAYRETGQRLEGHVYRYVQGVHSILVWVPAEIHVAKNAQAAGMHSVECLKVGLPGNF